MRGAGLAVAHQVTHIVDPTLQALARMLFLARRRQIGDGDQHRGVRFPSQLLLDAALPGRVLPLVGIGGEPLHDGRFVRVLLLHAGNQCQPDFLARDALVVSGGGAVHHRGDG